MGAEQTTAEISSEQSKKERMRSTHCGKKLARDRDTAAKGSKLKGEAYKIKTNALKI